MLQTIRDFDVAAKRILIRCDFNVPLDNKGNILDDFRIKKSLPTIRYLLENRAKIILMSHLDDSDIGSNASIDLIKSRIEKLLGVAIKKSNDCVGPETESEALNLKNEEILLLENLRIHKEEIENNDEFAKKLSALGEIYVNDAFAVCHRVHASIVGVPKFLPHCAGFLLEKEVDSLNKVLKNPERPLAVLIGGKKVHDKVKFIKKMLELADFVIISGLIKNELLKEKHPHILENVRMFGPENNLNATDINDKTIKLFQKKIMSAKTILWSGPFGKIEDEKYKKGTLAVANAIIKSGAFSVVGGGETVEFLNKEGLIDKFSHVSTGGGAMLDFLSGEELPGIKALES